MTTWRKIRDTFEMNKTGQYRTENLHGARELAAWPDMWVLRGGSSATGYTLYGLDIQANQLAWSLSGLLPPGMFSEREQTRILNIEGRTWQVQQRRPRPLRVIDHPLWRRIVG